MESDLNRGLVYASIGSMAAVLAVFLYLPNWADWALAAVSVIAAYLGLVNLGFIPRRRSRRVEARSPGSVAIGGDNTGSITTNTRGSEEPW